MTEKRLYRCDICNTDYADKNEAIKCEKEHVLPRIEVKDFRYPAHVKYPTKVLVKFVDGKEIWYKQ